MDGGGEDERVIHHQRQAPPVRFIEQPRGLIACRCQRFLHPHVLARTQRRHAQLEVSVDRRCDHHRIHRGVIDDIVGTGPDFRRRVPCRHPFESVKAHIADSDDSRIRQLCEISDKVGAPIAVAKDADRDHRRARAAPELRQARSPPRVRRSCRYAVLLTSQIRRDARMWDDRKGRRHLVA